MQVRLLKTASYLLLSFILLFTFQNCGGFQAADGSADFSSSSTNLVGAKVLKVNPYVDSRNPTLPFNSDLNNYLSEVEVSKPLIGVTYLATRKFSLDRDDAYPNQVVKFFEPLSFSYNDPRFLHVNVYYHVDNFVRRLEEAQIFPSNFVPNLKIRPRCDTGARSNNNAYFSPTEGLICMGSATYMGTRLWSGFDSDVTVHEFGHAVNHSAVTEDALFSTLDTWALDEGMADVWAFLTNGQTRVGNWYNHAIAYAVCEGCPEVLALARDLSQAVDYPVSMELQAHADGRLISSVFFELAGAGVSKVALHKLLMRSLENIQAGDTFAEVSKYLIEEAQAAGVNPQLVINALSRRNLYRKDSLANVELAAANLHIMDNHAFGILKNGNCNQQLDVGEIAVVFPDFVNSGPSVGAIRFRVTSSSADLPLEPGADTGTVSRLLANSTLKRSIPNNSDRDVNITFPSVIVKPMRAGNYTLTYSLTAYNSMDNVPVTKSFTVPVTVGTAPNVIGPCPGGLEDAIWP